MPVLYEQLTGRVPIEHVGDNWYVAMPIRHPGTGALWPIANRLFDIASAGLGSLLLLPFLPLIARALREHVEPGYQRRVEWFEWPDVLLYRAGGRYDLHTDADLRDKGTGVWHRVMDRDFSVLIYLNDDFAGGQLAFPRRGETIRPETGMLVAFPSDHRFAHADHDGAAGLSGYFPGFQGDGLEPNETIQY
mgnify:CR=1 FL=1